MIGEEFEFELSEYLDGTLSAERRAAVEERLRADSEARAVLEEFARLDATIRRVAAPVPEMKWDRVAECISSGIDESVQARQGWVRVGFSYSRLAMAASVLIAIGLMGVWMDRPTGVVPGPIARQIGSGNSVITVEGPVAEVASGSAVMDVEVSPPAEGEAAASYSGESLLERPSLVALDGFTSIDQVH